MKLPRDITPGAAARRALLADTLIAIAVALLVIITAAGLGVVGFAALGVFVVVAAWSLVEFLVQAIRRRRSREASSRSRRARTAAPGPNGAQASGLGPEMSGDSSLSKDRPRESRR